MDPWLQADRGDMPHIDRFTYMTPEHLRALMHRLMIDEGMLEEDEVKIDELDLDVALLTIDELGLDSLDMIELISELETTFRIDMDIDNLEEATFTSLSAYINDLTGNAPPDTMVHAAV